MNDRQTSGPDLQDQSAADIQQPTPPKALDLVAAKLTDVGRKRPHNEDFVEYYVPTDPQQVARKGAIYLVADGMGGHQAGEVASQGAVDLMIRQYYGDPEPNTGKSLARAVRAANQQIHNQAQADVSKSGMGTTLVAAVVLGRKVYVVNVGDSRAYLINSRGITQITEDHSWVEEQVRAGLLTPEQARRHPQRNLVTRALGSKSAVEVDLFEGEISAGDTLLLCSDGLTGRVNDQEIAAIVQESPPPEAVRRLVAQANERGGNDNISVLIVRAQEEQVTVMMPARPEPTRRSRFIPILIGAAAILALILGGLAVWHFFLREKPSATPTDSQPISTSTSTVTPSPESLATATEEATPNHTGMPSPIQSETPAVPTATLAPMPTATPQSTPTSTAAQPVISELPTATRNTLFPAPTLMEPPPGLQLKGIVLFKWAYYRPLRDSEAFQVLVWPQGEKDHQGADQFWDQTEQPINLDIALPPRGGPGLYSWSVVVVDKDSKERISEEAGSWSFRYVGSQPTTEPTSQPRQTEPTVSPIDTAIPQRSPPPVPSVGPP